MLMIRSRCIYHAIRPYSTSTKDPLRALTERFEPQAARAGALAGLKYVVKDNICTKIGSTTCSSRILGAGSERPYQSPFDATCVKLLDDAGAQLVGKTNMDEFGMGSFSTHSVYGPTLNPHDPERVSGGSSGGSAAALFSSDIDFSLGTDTGGSVRIPASYCGLYGFKPSYGMISRLGVIPYANSLDTVGIMVRNDDRAVNLLQRVYSVLSRQDEADPTSLKTQNRTSRELGKGRTIRIGIPADYCIEELSEHTLKVWKSCLLKLAEHKDIELVPIALSLTKEALAAYYVLAPSEASSNLQKYSGVFYGSREYPDRPDGKLYTATRDLFGDEVKSRIIMGCMSLSSDRFDNFYLQAQRVRRRIISDFNAVFRMQHPLLPSQPGSVDYLVTPVTPTVAPRLEEVNSMTAVEAYASDVMTVPASMAGLPALSVPFGEDDTGMPIGMQILGQYGDDSGVLTLAQRLR